MRRRSVPSASSRRHRTPLINTSPPPTPEGSCVSACPDGFYGDEDTNDCEECHAVCTRCDGPEEGDCLSCEDGEILESGRCAAERETCPAKTFRGGEANASVLRLIRPSRHNESGIWAPSKGQGETFKGN